MRKAHQLTVSPDFAPKNTSAWFIFNTWLQRRLNLPIHLELFNDFASQREAIASGEIDIIFANPYDASMLVRRHDFAPVARPAGGADECVVVVPATSTVTHVEDLQAGIRIASTEDPDVELIGMILLEPADLDRSNTQPVVVASYPLVAAQLLRGRADVGFILEAAYEDLSSLTRRQLRPLVRSQISDIRHVILIGPRLRPLRERVRRLLLGMHEDPAGASLVTELGVRRWETMEPEDTEFMIDLMDTLKA